ncbi:MAG: Cell division inhibitor [Thermomicrobiales bacterium]|nr:Cell division inhibitor [Thermomicrobiales bacterium]
MTETTLSYRSEIAAPAADVLRWHSNPGAFERLTPPWMDVRVLDGSGGIEPGHWKRLRVGVGPLGVPWTLVHHAIDDGTGFVDEQSEGPFASWRHEHRFSSDGPERSVLEDRISYRLPFGAAGQLVVGGQFEGRLNELFRFRHARTKLDLARHAGAGLARPQRIAISGASGLIGSQLVPFLRTGGHDVARLVRGRPSAGDEIAWDPASGRIDAASLEGMDAVIHLAGASIAGGRWTNARKTAILSSRLQGTSLLAETLARLQRPPRVLISASGIGYYGDAGSTPLTEESLPGTGFLADVCRAWEEATAPAAASGIRVVLPRFGIVLSGRGGLLARLALPFRFGLGGPLGSGEQFMSWIALDDLLGVLLRAIADDRLAGPVNAVAPHAVSNRVFAETLGRVLGRPTVLRTPARALRLVAGELADELILASQLARPAHLEDVGFSFAFPTLEDALRHELGRSGGNRDAEIPATSLRSAAQPGHSR